jgi:serine/threonine protein kinase
MWDRLHLIKKLGEGGMGQVWLAYDRTRGAQFAAKQLHPHLVRPKDLARLQWEIENLKALQHPNIVRLIEASDDPGRPGYLMEYCPGGSLETAVAETSVDTARAIQLFLQVLAGLKYAHNSPGTIVHRDIKPGNILIGADGNAKLSDFGLSVVLDGEQTRVTTSNWISPGFSPPEQYHDFAGVDQRGDIYAIGSVFHYLLMTRPYDPRVSLAGVADPMKRLLELMLPERPEDRCESIEAVEDLWRRLNSRDELERYPALRRQERLERLEQVADVYCGMDDDFGKINRAAWFLDAAARLESDSDILARIASLRAHVDREGRAMEVEMEQENPPY